MKKFKNTSFLAIMLLTTGFSYSLEKQEQIQKALLNIKDNEGATPLHRAVQNNHFESAKTLLESGARPNVKDKNGQTPLHYAVKLENATEFIKLLIKHGARPNARNAQDQRAIDLADNSQIKELLITLGTRVRATKSLAQEQSGKEDQEASSITLEEISQPLPASENEAKSEEELENILEEIVLDGLPAEQSQEESQAQNPQE